MFYIKAILQFIMTQVILHKVRVRLREAKSSRNWRTPRYGSFGHFLAGYVTACLPFGTRKEALVVATHGIKKKTQKTPKREIEKAEKLRKEYFNDKNK